MIEELRRAHEVLTNDLNRAENHNNKISNDIEVLDK